MLSISREKTHLAQHATLLQLYKRALEKWGGRSKGRTKSKTALELGKWGGEVGWGKGCTKSKTELELGKWGGEVGRSKGRTRLNKR